MKRYSNSMFRVGLLAVMLVAVVLIANSGSAQTRPAAAPTPTVPSPAAPETTQLNLMSLIMGHLDFVFYTIFILSIAGLALIIQGFIRNRESVIIPPETV